MTSAAKIHGLYVGIIVVLILVMAGGFYTLHKQSTAQTRVAASAFERRPGAGGPPPGGRMGGMSMAAATPPAISDQQTQQVTAGTSTATTEKTFNITGGNFYFVPNTITVNKGDKVTFVMTNAGGFHNIYLDEFGIKSPTIKTAEATTVTFTATQSGSYVYYCNVPGHRAKGMWGTLTVK